MNHIHSRGYQSLMRIGRVSCLALFLSGCFLGNERMDDLKAKLAAVEAKPKGSIEPLPEFSPYEGFTYSVAALRSPFQPPLQVQLDAKPKGDPNIKPDFDRLKEPLEEFSIDSLNMVGTLKGTDGKLWALIGDGSGGVHRVRPGNYMGKNHGKISQVAEAEITVSEIVPDGHGGWIERPRAIYLKE